MPIEKTTATKLRHQGDTYIVLPSRTVHTLKHPEAIAILAYLLDKPANWEIRRADIMTRFTLGRDRYDRAMRELKANGLAWVTETRDSQGRIIDRQLNVSATGIPGTIPAGQSPKVGLSTIGENPNVGKTDHLHITESITHDISDGPAEKPAGPRRMREDWYPSRAVIQRAIVLGMVFNDIEAIIDEFRDYWIAQKTRRKSWDQTFMNRLKRIHEQQQRQGARHGKAATATGLLADDLEETLGAATTH